jgi:hypothetical protein
VNLEEDIPAIRLQNQQITKTDFRQPQEIVSWFCAMQAQEYAMARWAIGLRLPSIRETEVEKAFSEGAILRTHLLRPTWHFVAPEDIRWLLRLTAPRVKQAAASYWRKMSLDAKVFRRSHDTLIKSLEGGKQLNRLTLKAALDQEQIDTSDTRLAHLLMGAELEGIICSGPREGKQFTYALLEERVPMPGLKFDNDEALTELAGRYFRSRGPATLQDYVWWSGLKTADARKGMESLGKDFIKQNIGGQQYVLYGPSSEQDPKRNTSAATFLMPDYDEYAISYKDRSAIVKVTHVPGLPRGGNPIFNHMVVLDGIIQGSWLPKSKSRKDGVETKMLGALNKKQQAAVQKAMERYEAFLG